MFLFEKDARMETLLHPSPDDLEGLDESLSNLRGPSGSAGSPDLVFQYSAALISHAKPSYVREGITLMEGLVFQYWQQERRRHALPSTPGLSATAPPPSEGELDTLASKQAPQALLPVYYYYIALGWTKLEDLTKARSSIERMLQLEPSNGQGIALRDYIDKEQTKEGVIGLAGLTAAAVAAAAVVFGAFRRH